MYVMLYIRLDICFVVGIVSRYQSNVGQEHQIVVKHIHKYLRRMRDYMFMFQSDELVPNEYIDSNFQSDKDSHWSTSSIVVTFDGMVVSCRSVKQSYIVDSTMEVEYVATSKVGKEVVWLRKLLMELGVVPLAIQPMILFCDNSGDMTQSKEPKNTKKVNTLRESTT